MEKYEIDPKLKDRVKNFESYLLKKKSGNLKDDDIKIYLLNKELLKHECYYCQQKPFWNNKPLDLILDRKNNIFTDNRINNLRLLCPNCFYQFKTKKTIFINKTKTNFIKCLDCKKNIKVTTTGKGSNKCTIRRCKECLDKAITGFNLDEYKNINNTLNI